MKPQTTVCLMGALGLLSSSGWAADFAVEVIECVPAPGQFVNNPVFNDPLMVPGLPAGGGTASPDNSSVMSLGGFGGSIVLRFDHTVADDPGNYLGLDFIVFSNATWASGDPQRRWAEPAHVEIMRDLDSNGLPGTAPGEVWYLIPGSVLSDASTYRSQTWDDVTGDPYPPDNVNWFPWIGTYPYLPEGPCVIPLDENGRYATSAYELPVSFYSDPGGQGGLLGVIVNPNLGDADPANDPFEGVYGYAELSPTLKLGDLDGDNVVDDPGIAAADFYTMPDNPFRVGATPGSGGGDAFDIAWAVDPATWQPANLDGFDFIRITGAVDLVLGILGEVSPEIDAVADVRPVPCPGDLDRNHDVDLVDLIRLRNLDGVEDPAAAFSIVGDLVQDGRHDVRDLVELRARRLDSACE
jgi:hypothetical protein